VRLHDEHIITVYDHWQDPECYVFTTELLTYTLSEFVRLTHGVVISVITDWCEQILKGLKYLHLANEDKGTIVHRDIRLDNLFFIHNGGAGQIKIGDLGLATIQKPEPKSARATTEYTAPEFYTNIYNEKVDIWSFGMCVIEMVTLKHPYEECNNSVALCKAVTTGFKPRVLFKIKDSQLIEFICCCIEMEPEQRYSAEQLLAHVFITTKDKKSNLEFFQLRSDEEALQLHKEYGTTKEGWDIYLKNIIGSKSEMSNGTQKSTMVDSHEDKFADGSFDEIIEDRLEEIFNQITVDKPPIQPSSINPNSSQQTSNTTQPPSRNSSHKPSPPSSINPHTTSQPSSQPTSNNSSQPSSLNPRTGNSPLKTRTDQQMLMNILSFEQEATSKSTTSSKNSSSKSTTSSLRNSNKQGVELTRTPSNL
jgi:serine/threonine protein kinase